MTMALALLDPRRHEVMILNAGPPAAAVASRAGPRRGGGRARSGPAAGRRAGGRLRPASLPLAPGESLIMYTDGITEAMNQRDDLYGSARLLRMSAGEADGVGRLGRRILDDVRALRRRPAAERRHVPGLLWKGESGLAGLLPVEGFRT